VPATGAIALLLAAHLFPPAQDPSTIERVRALAESGDYPGALSTARAEPEPLAAVQAEVWLYFRARDFRASLEAAERGLRAAPGDPWLLERASASALRLGAPELASAWTERFAAAVTALPPGDAQAWQAQLDERRRACSELVGARQQAAAALRRARGVALGLLCTALAVLTTLTLRRG